MTTTVEYRVRPVTRYIVTKFEKIEPDEHVPIAGARSSVVGEFPSQDAAHLVADAMAYRDAKDAPFHLPAVKWEAMEEPPQALPGQ